MALLLASGRSRPEAGATRGRDRNSSTTGATETLPFYLPPCPSRQPFARPHRTSHCKMLAAPPSLVGRFHCRCCWHAKARGWRFSLCAASPFLLIEAVLKYASPPASLARKGGEGRDGGREGARKGGTEALECMGRNEDEAEGELCGKEGLRGAAWR